MATLVVGCEGDRRVAETLRRVMRWRWPLIVVAFLPSALIAVTLVELQPERHEAVSVIAVVPGSPEIANPDLIQLAVDRYVVLLQSEGVLLRVAQESGVSLATLRSGVSVAAAPQSANVRVVASTPTARQARAAADAVAEEGVSLAASDPTVGVEVLASATDQALPLTASPGSSRRSCSWPRWWWRSAGRTPSSWHGRGSARPRTSRRRPEWG